MPLCGKHLQTITPQNQTAADYEIIPIEESKGVKYENLIAVCHDCFLMKIAEALDCKVEDLFETVRDSEKK